VSGAYRPDRRPTSRRLDPAVYRRRRVGVCLVALLIVALLVGVISLIGGGGPSSQNNGLRTTTTTTLPRLKPTGIGARTVTWTDTNPNAGLVVNPAPGGSAGPRTLVTEIWYPSIGGSSRTPTVGAKPDYQGGPFPVIVFAHGFDTVPATYTPLLASWVKAGFVVVAPLFPDENANKLNSLGTRTVTQSELAESDVVNEPYDIAYVAGQVEAGAGGTASSGAAWLKGLAEPGKIALAGHSDGAQAVAALVYSEKYASTYEEMAARPFAVLILSGSELAGVYAPPANPPPVLFVQSGVDSCNLPQDAETLFHDAGGGFFLKLVGAHHFSPYVGIGPAAPVVERLTAAFLEEALVGAPSPSGLSASGDAPGVAALYGPSKPPSLTALPAPSEAQRSAACTVPD
jgi:dienelactone hydrolase